MKDLILVTGGTGYIGSHTAVELIQSGFDVVIIDDLSNSRIDSLNGIEEITGVRPEFEEFDLCDKEKLGNFFDNYQNVKAIIHFAALKAVGESVNEPLKYYYNNLVSLMNLLSLMGEKNVKNLVFSSSCTVYGQPEELPVTESAPTRPAESPYGNTKQISEEIIRDTMSAVPEINTIALRYFNPIGAHPSGIIGEYPMGIPNNLVPFITQTAAGLHDHLRVYGDDYDTPDGTAIRDYINVNDLAAAHVTAIERLLNGKNKSNYEFFNLGTGQGTSVMQLIKTFEKVNGVKVDFKIIGRREGDIEKVWADTSFANSELGWKAEKSLEETLASAWKWEKNLRGIK
jgi:UDP-glucose 4-epimerase